MSKRSVFTHITPLPANVTRERAVEWLHNHQEMIQLNPLVIRYRRCEPHNQSPKEEHSCYWYEMTDKINYLPGGLMKGEVTYKGAFHNLPSGLQTHVYAPAGLELREKWTVCGNMPGEPREPVELGSGITSDGLYIREDVDMRCNVFLTGFVKKNLNKSHKVLVDSIVRKASEPIPKRAERRSTVPLQRTAPRPEPQELPTPAQDDLQKELPACQCPAGHDPTCSMYDDPTIGRFADLQVDDKSATSHGPVAYEEFSYVKMPTTAEAADPELFSGNFHPLSHYQLLLGNSKNSEDEASFVQTTKMSLVRAELPATPSRAATT
ncbi:hypothetical protein AMS68_000132 [Peltaster fructicola]|uniref:DUF7053 domain-containing protein n=1 Tax=Peltaster fructicola TaxID=286661 RepID=A0A6H0XJ13_9PEZI|nr:hypothetical protein AMS68_000132 [Peltaster fructicola]